MSDTDLFLEEVSKELNVSLSFKPVDSCIVQLPSEIQVVFERNEAKKHINVVCLLLKVEPSVHTDQLLEQSLKCNNPKNEITGSLCLIEKTNTLALYQKYKLSNANYKALANSCLHLLQSAVYLKQFYGTNQPLPFPITKHMISNEMDR